jgi:hypothetical protein
MITSNNSNRSNKLWLLIACLAFLGVACRLTSKPELPAPEIPVSTEAAGILEQNVEGAVQQAEQTGIFELTLTEEQITSYLLVKLQEKEDFKVTYLQLFLRDGTMQAFTEIEQNSVLLPLEFVVEPQIPATGYPKLIVTSAKVAGLPAPNLLIDTIQQSLDEAYAMMLQNGGSTFVTQSITIADGLMTIRGSVK